MMQATTRAPSPHVKLPSRPKRTSPTIAQTRSSLGVTAALLCGCGSGGVGEVGVAHVRVLFNVPVSGVDLGLERADDPLGGACSAVRRQGLSSGEARLRRMPRTVDRCSTARRQLTPQPFANSLVAGRISAGRDHDQATELRPPQVPHRVDHAPPQGGRNPRVCEPFAHAPDEDRAYLVRGSGEASRRQFRTVARGQAAVPTHRSPAATRRDQGWPRLQRRRSPDSPALVSQFGPLAALIRRACGATTPACSHGQTERDQQPQPAGPVRPVPTAK
jgi:hypothetical protein